MNREELRAWLDGPDAAGRLLQLLEAATAGPAFPPVLEALAKVEVSSKEVVEVLIAGLSSVEPRVALACVEALGRTKTEQVRVVREFCRLLDAGTPGQAVAVARSISAHPSPSWGPCVESLVRAAGRLLAVIDPDDERSTAYTLVPSAALRLLPYTKGAPRRRAVQAMAALTAQLEAAPRWKQELCAAFLREAAALLKTLD
jgi:hypothetical protein